MKKNRLLFALIISCLYCIPLFLAAQQKGSILLAYEKTSFKDALIAELETRLKADGYTVVVAIHTKKGLDKYNASDFSAIFITNSGVNSEVRPWVTQWINKNKNSKSYILLHTTQIKDWTVNAGVDSVTSASTQADVKDLAIVYHNKIVKVLNKGE